MNNLELARHFMQMLEDGNVDGARACLAEDAGIWHDFDNVTQSVNENMALFSWMISKCKTRHYEITRLEEIEGGYLQQHILTVISQDDHEMTAFACCVVSVAEGKITHIEEYIDSSKFAGLSA